MKKLKLTLAHKLTLIVTGAVVIGFIGGYLLAMHLVSQGVNAPFAPQPSVFPGRGCNLSTSSATYACPLIPVN